MDRSGANRGAVFEVPVIRTRLEHGFRDGWLAFLAFAFRFSNKRRDISSRGKGLSWLVRRLRGRLPRGERQGHRSRKSESETDYHGAHKTSKCTSRITLLSDPATGPFKPEFPIQTCGLPHRTPLLPSTQRICRQSQSRTHAIRRSLKP